MLRSISRACKGSCEPNANAVQRMLLYLNCLLRKDVRSDRITSEGQRSEGPGVRGVVEAASAHDLSEI